MAFDAGPVLGAVQAQVDDALAAKAQLSNIPWHQLYGMRNRIVHGYSGVNMRIIWDTVSSDIPALNTELEEVIVKLSNSNNE